MAKELPYFRFTPQEWQNGDISLLSNQHKGLFIDVCSYYWIKDCSITKALLELRFSNNKELLKDLLKYNIITHDKESDFVSINFLDEQFDSLSELRKRRQEAGRKGGKQNKSKAKAKLKQNGSYKDKDNNSPFVKSKFSEPFYEWLEYKKGRREKYKTEKSTEAAYNRLVKLSDNNTETAKEIVEQSMANNWAGLFELKNYGKNRGNNRNSFKSDATKQTIKSIKNEIDGME